MTTPSERRKGHSKLVYNKATRTIDTVDPHPTTPPAPMPEPVAWRVDGTQCGQPAVFFYYKQNAMLQGHIDQGDKITPLYAAPMPEREETDEIIARRLATVMHGDDVEWRSFVTKAHHWMSLSMDAESSAPIPEREGMRVRLNAEDIGTIQAAVENLRSPDKKEERTIEAAWRIASKLEKIARAALAPHDKTEG